MNLLKSATAKILPDDIQFGGTTSSFQQKTPNICFVTRNEITGSVPSVLFLCIGSMKHRRREMSAPSAAFLADSDVDLYVFTRTNLIPRYYWLMDFR